MRDITYNIGGSVTNSVFANQFSHIEVQLPQESQPEKANPSKVMQVFKAIGKFLWENIGK